MFEETLDQSENKQPRRIGFGPRLGASILDGVLMMVIIPLISMLMMGMGATDFLAQKGLDALKADEKTIEMLEKALGEYFMTYLVVVALGATVGILYNLIEGFTGASPGKMILGFQVANADGTKGDFNVFMMRWLLKNISGVFSVVNLILNNGIIAAIGSILGLGVFFGCFLALGENKQALHDVIAKTAVYKRKEIRD